MKDLTYKEALLVKVAMTREDDFIETYANVVYAKLQYVQYSAMNLSISLRGGDENYIQARVLCIGGLASSS